MEGRHSMFTDDVNAQVVLALLKKYGIKKIVVSPGTTNVPISRSVQVDPWFEVYSVVDERSAAYFAGGLAYETGEPVVISCTGATASRNYLPGLTEAYYRNLPVIALTSQHHTSDVGNLVPQITDRTVSQNDVKKISVLLPVVKDDIDFERCVISVNKALITATNRGSGPVHINLPVSSLEFSTKKLPEVRKIDYVNSESLVLLSKKLGKELLGKKIVVFIGAYGKFDQETIEALEKFAQLYGAAVVVDHTSSYKGKNSILISQISDLKESANRPELVIDMGSVTGEYCSSWLNGIQTWRISEDGEIHDRFRNQIKLFDCSIAHFFDVLGNLSLNSSKSKLYISELQREVENINIPDLPLSNTLISYELSQLLSGEVNLHLGILNSLRNMNFFPLQQSVDTSSNVGGFGIDGALSTLVGQSMANKNKLYFGLIGDLAAFYDMNALGNRHITNNLRILMVNNGGGVEFRLNNTLEAQWSSDTDEFISAHGHFGSMKGWASSMGFHYISANNKNEFYEYINSFCSKKLDKFEKPVLFEVFTKTEDEQLGWEMMRRANKPQNINDTDSQLYEPKQGRVGIRKKIKRVTPKPVKNIYRKIRKK